MRLALAVVGFAAVLTACSADPTVSPTDFARAHSQDAHSVVVSVQEVETGVGMMTDDSFSSPAALASFDGVVTDAQSSFDKVHAVLLEAAKPEGVEDGEVEMWSATDELSQAMKSLRAYVDDQRPSDLADYKSHWDKGRAWWNQAVNNVWGKTSIPTPSIPNAPSAPPPT